MPTKSYFKPTFVLLGCTVLWELLALRTLPSLLYPWIVATINLFGFIYAFHDLAGGGVYALHLDLDLLFCYIRDNAGAALLFAAPRVGRFFSFSRLPRSKGLCDKVLRMVTYGGVVSFFTTFSPHCATWSNTSCVVRRDF